MYVVCKHANLAVHSPSAIADAHIMASSITDFASLFMNGAAMVVCVGGYVASLLLILQGSKSRQSRRTRCQRGFRVHSSGADKSR